MMIKFIRITFVLAVCLLLWFTLSNISYNAYVSYSKNSLLNKIDSVSPFGKYVSYEPLEEEIDSSYQNMKIRSLFQSISYIGQTTNNEFIYEIPERIKPWIIRHRETTKEGLIKSGSITPVQILSKYQITEIDFYNILNEAFNIKLNQFDTYSKEKYHVDGKALEIIDKSDFKVGTDLSIDYYQPCSSEYIEVGTSKVLTIDEGGEYNYILKSKYNEKKLKNKIYFSLGILCIILFFVVIRFSNNLFKSKKTLALGIVFLLCTCGIILGLYLIHASRSENRERSYYMNLYETDVRRQYPPLEDLVVKVRYIKNLELEYAKANFNPYYANESVTRTINALYASSYELRGLSVFCLQSVSLALAQKGLTMSKDDKVTRRSRYKFQDIAWTTKQLNDMNIFRITSEFDLNKYENECDSLSLRLNTLIGDFIEDNRTILKR